MKIALTGCSGTGKTTLARAVAKLLKVPTVVGTAKELLEQHHYSWGWHGQVERFIEQNGLQLCLFDMQKQRENEHTSFVTDRAGVEQAAYAIIESRQTAEKQFDLPGFLDRCRDYMNNYDMIFYIPWNGGVTDHESGYRFSVDSIINRLLVEWKVKYTRIIDAEKEFDDIARDVVEWVKFNAPDFKSQPKRSRGTSERLAPSRKRVPDQRREARQKQADRRPSRSKVRGQTSASRAQKHG
jgi:phosphoribulokinase